MFQYGTYTPFTEFPTPELLSKAQLDYKEANVEHKLDENGIPLPFSPRTTKSEVFNPKDYEDIDEHARKVSDRECDMVWHRLFDMTCHGLYDMTGYQKCDMTRHRRTCS